MTDAGSKGHRGLDATNGVVVTYSSRSGAPLRPHQRAMLAVEAKAIATLKQYEFGGQHDDAKNFGGPVFFVPDDTLLLDEARSLGIRGASDLYGGVVPHAFAKTKSITHPLVDENAQRPDGWSFGFGERVRDVVLAGYTAFSVRDARIAASRMLASGPVRVKEPLHAGGQGQTLVTTMAELDVLLDRLPADDIRTYGLVMEENLQHVATLSIGQVTLAGETVTYHGLQRVTTDNERRPVYGGSDLVCVRGGWDALDRLPMSAGTREASAQARRYDAAMNEYPGFMASRRNYDVGQGVDGKARRRSAVFESSWRAGGASAAELLALAEFVRDPSLQVVEASHVEEFGKSREAPPGAVTHFQGDDPEAGPMLRYTLVKRVARNLRCP